MVATDWLQLDGRACLVAGAGGLGGECAVALARQGARVVVADIDEDGLDRVRDRAARDECPVHTLTADFRDPDSCRRTVAEAHAFLGALDVFVHAVGRNVRRPVVDIDDDAWNDILALNLSSAFWLGQSVGKVMCHQRRGRMVFVSSVSGLLAHPDHAPYAAAKAGMNQMLRVMAREWAACDVTVNAVAPGYIETDLTHDYLERDGNRGKLTAMVPSGRLGVPSEVADSVVFLASDRARFVTGHVLYVDGGRVLV